MTHHSGGSKGNVGVSAETLLGFVDQSWCVLIFVHRTSKRVELLQRWLRNKLLPRQEEIASTCIPGESLANVHSK